MRSVLFADNIVCPPAGTHNGRSRSRIGLRPLLKNYSTARTTLESATRQVQPVGESNSSFKNENLAS